MWANGLINAQFAILLAQRSAIFFSYREGKKVNEEEIEGSSPIAMFSNQKCFFSKKCSHFFMNPVYKKLYACFFSKNKCKERQKLDETSLRRQHKAYTFVRRDLSKKKHFMRQLLQSITHQAAFLLSVMLDRR